MGGEIQGDFHFYMIQKLNYEGTGVKIGNGRQPGRQKELVMYQNGGEGLKPGNLQRANQKK